MAQLIKFKRSTGSGVPSGLVTGELAYSGGRSQLFIGASSGSKVVVDASILNSATSTVAANVALKDGEGAGANTFTLKGSNAITGDVAFTLPATLPGSGSSQILVDSSGALALGDGNISNLQDIANIDQGGVTVDDILIWDNSASEWKHITQGEYNALFGLGPATNQAFNNVTLTGNLNVEGTNAILDASTVTVRDKSIIMGVGNITTDITTDMTAGVVLLDPADGWSDGDALFVEDGNSNVPEGLYTVDVAPSFSTAGHSHTGTFTDSNGATLTYYAFTGNGSFTVGSDIDMHVLLVGKGGDPKEVYMLGGGDAGMSMNHYQGYVSGPAGGEMEYHKGLTVSGGTYNIVIDNQSTGGSASITELGFTAAAGHNGHGNYGGGSAGANYTEDGVTIHSGGAGSGSHGGGAGANGDGNNASYPTAGSGGPGIAEGGNIRNRVNNSTVTLEITGGAAGFEGFSGGGGGFGGDAGAPSYTTTYDGGNGTYGGGNYFGGAEGRNGQPNDGWIAANEQTSMPGSGVGGEGVVIVAYEASANPGSTSFDTGQSGVTQSGFSLTLTEPLTDTTIDGAGITISGTTDKTIQWHKSGGGYSDRFVLTGGSLSITSGDASTTLKLGETQEFISVDQGGAAGSLNSAVTVSFDAVDDDDEFDFGVF